ncbi:hypothetical protein CBR_g36358 [Chara braunii]|uniref:General transcription and DNA repair factor IIH subunit TFB4 n=1 Tax=Chara braunii TaxID=69332 RepID=A0A388LKM1_CHABU|nr:hypothetical protein CBR_g36358 [Chara braunii]|eukprot:GBG82827.1 hypothetical protein CBR_g36358 [Chara braunii]
MEDDEECAGRGADVGNRDEEESHVGVVARAIGCHVKNRTFEHVGKWRSRTKGGRIRSWRLRTLCRMAAMGRKGGGRWRRWTGDIYAARHAGKHGVSFFEKCSRRLSNALLRTTRTVGKVKAIEAAFLLTQKIQSMKRRCMPLVVADVLDALFTNIPTEKLRPEQRRASLLQLSLVWRVLLSGIEDGSENNIKRGATGRPRAKRRGFVTIELDVRELVNKVVAKLVDEQCSDMVNLLLLADCPFVSHLLEKIYSSLSLCAFGRREGAWLELLHKFWGTLKQPLMEINHDCETTMKVVPRSPANECWSESIEPVCSADANSERVCVGNATVEPVSSCHEGWRVGGGDAVGAIRSNNVCWSNRASTASGKQHSGGDWDASQSCALLKSTDTSHCHFRHRQTAYDENPAAAAAAGKRHGTRGALDEVEREEWKLARMHGRNAGGQGNRSFECPATAGVSRAFRVVEAVRRMAKSLIEPAGNGEGCREEHREFGVWKQRVAGLKLNHAARVSRVRIWLSVFRENLMDVVAGLEQVFEGAKMEVAGADEERTTAGFDEPHELPCGRRGRHADLSLLAASVLRLLGTALRVTQWLEENICTREENNHSEAAAVPRQRSECAAAVGAIAACLLPLARMVFGGTDCSLKEGFRCCGKGENDKQSKCANMMPFHSTRGSRGGLRGETPSVRDHLSQDVCTLKVLLETGRGHGMHPSLQADVTQSQLQLTSEVCAWSRNPMRCLLQYKLLAVVLRLSRWFHTSDSVEQLVRPCLYLTLRYLSYLFAPPPPVSQSSPFAFISTSTLSLSSDSTQHLLDLSQIFQQVPHGSGRSLLPSPFLGHSSCFDDLMVNDPCSPGCRRSPFRSLNSRGSGPGVAAAGPVVAAAGPVVQAAGLSCTMLCSQLGHRITGLKRLALLVLVKVLRAVLALDESDIVDDSLWVITNTCTEALDGKGDCQRCLSGAKSCCQCLLEEKPWHSPKRCWLAALQKSVSKWVRDWERYLQPQRDISKESIARLLVQIFDDDDDMMLLLLSDLQCLSPSLPSVVLDDGKDELFRKVLLEAVHPLFLFHVFLSNLKYDHSVLLDYLISPNTGAVLLPYLVKCLKQVESSWPVFQDIVVREGRGPFTEAVLVDKSRVGAELGSPASDRRKRKGSDDLAEFVSMKRHLLFKHEQNYRFGDEAAETSSTTGLLNGPRSLTFHQYMDQVIVFANSFLMLHHVNQLAVIATGANTCQYLYTTPQRQGSGLQQHGLDGTSNHGIGEGGYGSLSGSGASGWHAADDGRGGRAGGGDGSNPRAPLGEQLMQRMQRFLQMEIEASLGSGEENGGQNCSQLSLLSGALSMALCYIQRAKRGGPTFGNPRVLCLQGSADAPQQYIPIMNSIFSAQRLKVPIDGCVIGAQDSPFLQQAAHITEGLYLRPPRPDVLLQYLLMVFSADLHSRRFLQLPRQFGVDFRASCFCHKRTIDLGFVCSVCLSIFCQFSRECSTCGAVFSLAKELPNAQSAQGRKRKVP